MSNKIVKRKLPDTYFELVRQFPLTHIRNDDDLDAAQTMIDRLLEEELDDGAQAYLDALTDLFQAYEDRHEPKRDASQADVLRMLMAANGFTQQKLAKKIEISQSTISAVLNGNRTLTANHMVALGKFFHVSPAAFMPAHSNAERGMRNAE